MTSIRKPLLTFAALLAAAMAAVAQAPAATRPPSTPMSGSQFAAELQNWQYRVDQVASSPEQAAAVKATVPQKWTVTREGQTIDVPDDWLVDDLGKVAIKPSDAKPLDDARQRLAALRAQAEAADAPAISSAAERAKADEILSRREFGGVTQPTWLDKLRQRINEWIWRILDRTLGHVIDHPLLGNILVWVVIAAAIIVAAVLLYRRFTRRASEEEKLEEEEERRPAGWQTWAQQASAAAGRGDFREALRCSYWAAIYRLEMFGLWRPDPARTPREYLRAMPEAHSKRPPLVGITRQFELAWYAQRTPTQQDFEHSAEELEKLGCQLPSTKATGKS